jgi:hypothetical protein
MTTANIQPQSNNPVLNLNGNHINSQFATAFTNNPNSPTFTYDLGGIAWSLPQLVQTILNDNSVELIYKQRKISPDVFFYAGAQHSYCPERVYKIVCSCKDGQWHQSDPIYGEIIAPSGEQYEF